MIAKNMTFNGILITTKNPGLPRQYRKTYLFLDCSLSNCQHLFSTSWLLHTVFGCCLAECKLWNAENYRRVNAESFRTCILHLPINFLHSAIRIL